MAPVIIAMPLTPARREVVLEIDDDAGADQATPERPDPTEDGDEHDLPGRRPGDLLERGEPVADREDTTSHARQSGGDDEDDDLVLLDVVPERPSAGGVVADGGEDAAERRVDDAPGDEDADDDDGGAA
jgi:hypothetical protein